ncbi:multi-pass transmembrane protein [Cryptosporidium ryanae]|uniref:multi-pass transmembrane protein n=1 Tax=Cryptosporidium ryanae TaxID=515981 RepID=UPI00351A5D11|nr:multi-pass transmembrane protein [Cryptosporidium ryanae]
MKKGEIVRFLRRNVKSRIEDFKQGRQSWRLKEWHHLQSFIYLIYGIGSFIFVRLIANSSPDNNNYDHFVNDSSEYGSNLHHCGITPLFNFIPIPGSYILIIYSVYSLSILSMLISVTSFVLGFCFKYFSNIPRSYFFSPSKRTRLLGFSCKVFPITIQILNLLFILFLIVPFLYITTSGACYRRLVRFERNKVQNCRIWVNKCAKDNRIFGRHLECSLRKNFKHFPAEIVEDPTIGENLDILIGGPMPLLCPMCNEIRMDQNSPLYKGEAYVEQLKSSISKMESQTLSDYNKNFYQTDSVSFIQLFKGASQVSNSKKNDDHTGVVTQDIKTEDEESNSSNSDKLTSGLDIVSLNEPIFIDFNYDKTSKFQPPSKVNIPSKYKSIVNRYVAALSSQNSDSSLINEDAVGKLVHKTQKSQKYKHKSKHQSDIKRESNVENNKPRQSPEISDSSKVVFKFSGVQSEVLLSNDDIYNLNMEFEAARYQIQVTMHEASNFSRSIFVFMLISLIFWALSRFFSFVIFEATRTEACFYVPNTKKSLAWSGVRKFMDVLN